MKHIKLGKLLTVLAVLLIVPTVGWSAWVCTDADILCESFDDTDGKDAANWTDPAGTPDWQTANSGYFWCDPSSVYKLHTSAGDVALNTLGSDQSTFYATVFVRVTAETLADGESVVVLDYETSTGSDIAEIKVGQHNPGPNHKFLLSWKNNAGATATVDLLENQSALINQWYRIKLFWQANQASGGIQLKIAACTAGGACGEDNTYDPSGGTTNRSLRQVYLGAATLADCDYENLKISSTAYPDCDFSYSGDVLAKPGYWKPIAGASCSDVPGWTAATFQEIITIAGVDGTVSLCAGTHEIDADTISLSGQIFTPNSTGATISVTGTAEFKLDTDNTIQNLALAIASGAKIIAAAEVADPPGASQSGIVITGNTISGGGPLAFGQGISSYHSNCQILNNTFNGSNLYIEIADGFTITGNTFTNMGVLRSIQIWGGNNIIANNKIDSGIVGINFLSRHDLGGSRVKTTGNNIYNNVIYGFAEEGISFDGNFSNASYSAIRETDTVDSKASNNQIVLTDAGWTGDSSYTGSKYHAIWITGTNSGKIYLITTHSDATFTLDIPLADYNAISAGDIVSIGLPAYANFVYNNTVYSAANDTSGILLWGVGSNNYIQNNCVGTSEGTVDGAIRLVSISNISGTGSVTGNNRKTSVGGNTVTYNLTKTGNLSAYFYDYGSDPFDLPANTISNNLEDYDPLWVNSATGNFALLPGSPAGGSGVLITGYHDQASAAKDYAGADVTWGPSIGAYQPTGTAPTWANLNGAKLLRSSQAVTITGDHSAETLDLSNAVNTGTLTVTGTFELGKIIGNAAVPIVASPGAKITAPIELGNNAKLHGFTIQHE